jgi:hypothetical protein
MRITGAAAGLVLVAGLAVAADEKFTSKDGKYAVAFPGSPKTQTTKAGPVDLNITIVEKNMGGFAVIYSDLPAETLKVAKPKDLLDGGQKGLIDNFKAKLTKSNDIEFGKDKLPGREIVGEKDAMQLRLTLILKDNRLYQVFVVGPKDLVSGKDADDFFKSFEITK